MRALKINILRVKTARIETTIANFSKPRTANIQPLYDDTVCRLPRIARTGSLLADYGADDSVRLP